MFRERKDYRKSFNAVGTLSVGGEMLRFNCYDVSVKGAMIEVVPGALLATADDFENLLREDRTAEIFIEELMLAGEVNVVWVRGERKRILMGLEFLSVVHNAHKLWLKRRGYRKTEPFAVELFIDKDRLHVEGVNRSLKGLCVRLAVQHPGVRVDVPVKLQINELGLAALGRIAWVKSEDDMILVGLQIMPFK
ncbi:MAG: PilZ domain-containing protein [Methylomonas sp.]|nr:PilZ domain-containing protein [Methylomonas sp.]PPD21246.1 MAG: PilZ domain-containing protein [Methylomonas sp.]PPD27646.1 MAG: PilZ domain-containing protein [Methylomonas sp.]PPD39632.1 MAG: PilZ domain-containing protein [Methylomonas sp.]PPD51664.1 MAG: PilZ domain-containing protein [Methylomonas sp.]